ncbi:MAG: hypothetical protein ACRDRA_18910 [Pseudonocardiaceae bacterium]
MRGLPSVEQVGLSPVVEELLVDVVDDGFTLYSCGPKVAPNALITCYAWGQYADLLTVRDFDRVITARVPMPGDIFAPEVVVWAYEGPPQHAIRALLTLVHPAHPDAPVTEYPAPARLRVPRAQQRPMTIRLPTLSRAGARASRLTTAMTTHGPGWSPGENERPPTLGSRRPAVHQPGR